MACQTAHGAVLLAVVREGAGIVKSEKLGAVRRGASSAIVRLFRFCRKLDGQDALDLRPELGGV